MIFSTCMKLQRSTFYLALVLLFLFAPAAHSGFSFGFDGTTLTLTQISDQGAVTVDDNGAGTEFRATDGGGTTTYVAATNLVVNMLDNTGNQLDVDLDSALAGNLTLNLGDGARDVNMIGTNNGIGGSFTVNAGSDAQILEVAVNANLAVGDELFFSLGTGADRVDEDNNDISVTNDFTFIGVNFFENGGTATIGGNALVDVSFETEDTLWDDDATLTITGNLTYIGGSGRDEITMNGVAGGTSIGGFADINVADNTVGGNQFIFFNLPNSNIGGALTVTSTSAVNADNFSLHPSASVGGDIVVDLGDGPNDAVFSGTLSGASGTYLGGEGIDNVTMSAVAGGMDFDVFLAGAEDNFTLNTSTVLNRLFVDFGACSLQGGVVFGGNFVDGFGGTYPFEVVLENLVCTPVSIPSLNTAGFTLMAGLLALFGFGFLRRRQQI